MLRTLIMVTHGGMPPAGPNPNMIDVWQAKQCPPQSTYEGRKCRLELLGHALGTFDEEFLRADQPKSRIAREKMILINDSGHFPHRLHPDMFVGDIIQFIEFWMATLMTVAGTLAMLGVGTSVRAQTARPEGCAPNGEVDGGRPARIPRYR